MGVKEDVKTFKKSGIRAHGVAALGKERQRRHIARDIRCDAYPL